MKTSESFARVMGIVTFSLFFGHRVYSFYRRHYCPRRFYRKNHSYFRKLCRHYEHDCIQNISTLASHIFNHDDCTTAIKNDPDDDFIFYDEEQNQVYQLTESSLTIPLPPTSPCPRTTLPLTIYVWTTCSSDSLDENLLKHMYSIYSQGIMDGIYLAQKLSSPEDLMSSGFFDDCDDDDDDSLYDFCKTLSMISCIRHSCLHYPSHHILFLETKSSSSYYPSTKRKQSMNTTSSLDAVSTDIYTAFQTFVSSPENIYRNDQDSHIFLKNHMIQEIVERDMNDLNDLHLVLNDTYPSLHK